MSGGQVWYYDNDTECFPAIGCGKEGVFAGEPTGLKREVTARDIRSPALGAVIGFGPGIFKIAGKAFMDRPAPERQLAERMKGDK